MPTLPPPLENGYCLLANAAVTSDQFRRLKEKLTGNVRCRMKTRDLSEVRGDFITMVEFWVHPDDIGAISVVLNEVLANKSVSDEL